MHSQLTEFKVSVAKGSTRQFSVYLEKGDIAIDILDEHVISDVVDLDLIKTMVKEVELAREKKSITHPLMPVVVKYQGKAVMTVLPSGKKKIHLTSAAHLGVKVFFHKLSEHLQELSTH